ncbi:MAG: hypothetical protein ACLPUO_11595 [Streptosporangiaceae bacterium]|jgi:hypothetical protein
MTGRASLSGNRGRRWQLAGALAALIAAVAAVTAIVALRHPPRRPAAVSQRPATARPASPAGSPARAASSAAAGPPADGHPRQEARSLSALLALSSGDRSKIEAATANIAKCVELSQDQRTLESAAHSRQALLAALAQLNAAQLPHAKALVEMLTAAWRASMRSDRRYAAWAADQGRAGCAGPSPAGDANWQAAQRSDAQATLAKTRFAAVWSPIAAVYHLPQYPASRI